MVNINITIDENVHRQLKLNAITKQQTLKNLIIRCLEESIAQDPLLKNTFPGTSVPGISLSSLSKLSKGSKSSDDGPGPTRGAL